MEALERFKNLLLAEAVRLGFSTARVTPAVPASGFDRLQAWLAAGFAGEMEYLPARREAYAHPHHVLDGARSLVMLTTRYRTEPPSPPPLTPAPGGTGRVSRYAWGTVDYHDLIHSRLRQLVAHARQHLPSGHWRGVVDSAPLLEREYAALAGIGWVGKHTLLLDREEGSWFFLAALLTDVELPADSALSQEYCGSCRACLDACPTDAFPQEYVLDARRCISYLTIEHRSPIPHDLRPLLGDWIFGCDICQEVCPWNRRSPVSPEVGLQPQGDLNPCQLLELFCWDDNQFRDRFRHTPLWRTKRRGIVRNAAIVLGNQRLAAAVPALVRGLHDIEPLIRGAAAWALGQIGSADALAALQEAAPQETDPEVLSEIESARTAGSAKPQPG